MSSNSTVSSATSKASNVPPQVPSPSQSQAPSSQGPDFHSQRRNGGNGSSRTTMSAPRNNQAFRKQNKIQRRPKLADEDTAAEAVRLYTPDLLSINFRTDGTWQQAVIRSTSSRKGQTSITHLMNFTLPPRPQNHIQFSNPRNNRRNPTWGLGSGYHAVDKARWGTL